MNFTNEAEKTKVTDIISLFEGDYIVTNLFKPSWKKFPPVKSFSKNIIRLNVTNPVFKWPIQFVYLSCRMEECHIPDKEE
jgi:hypothetical protein